MSILSSKHMSCISRQVEPCAGTSIGIQIVLQLSRHKDLRPIVLEAFALFAKPASSLYLGVDPDKCRPGCLEGLRRMPVTDSFLFANLRNMSISSLNHFKTFSWLVTLAAPFSLFVKRNSPQTRGCRSKGK